MAHIDNLISAVTDDRLRAALQAEYSKALGQRQFGLVFNTHQPESVVLPELPIRNGDKVCARVSSGGDPTQIDDTGIWRVARRRTGEGTATIVNDQGEERDLLLDQLVAVREFGDPIYPGLRSTGKVANGPADKPWHTIINAENHHALEALLYPYEGKVDAIYIDPPYNTGARDWKYNNDYVDGTDPYAHSKWLSFMDRRLRLAKRLLNPESSTLVVTIDEKEVHRLGLLLEQRFPGAKTQMVTSVINTKGVARGREFARVEEYLFFVFLGDAGPSRHIDNMLNASDEAGVPDGPKETYWLSILRRGNSASRRDRPRLFYPVFVDEESARIHSVGAPIALDENRHSVAAPEGTVAIWPLRTDGTEGRWQIGPETLRDALTAGTARLGRRNARTGQWALNYLNEGSKRAIEAGELVVTGHAADGSWIVEAGERKRAVTARTVWNRKGHDASTHGSSLLRKLIPGRTFPYPKSLYAVEDTLRFIVGDNPQALVLDFFGGSGTTAHAVARLNREDGGSRRSIVVTNNEVAADEAKDLRARSIYPGSAEWEVKGICESITIPRVTAAVTGITPDGEPTLGSYAFGEQFPIRDGLKENVEFFELTYEDGGLVSLGRRFAAIAPLLWLKAGAVGPRIDSIDTDQGWSLPEGASYGVLFDTQHWAGFVDAVNRRQDDDRPLAHVFVVTDSINEFQQIVSRLDSSQAATRLYADFLRTFEINTGSAQ